MREEDLHRVSPGDVVVVVGTLIVLVSMFLPWWDSGVGVTANGFHDWGWLTFAGLLFVVVVMGLRAVDSSRTPELSVSDEIAFVIGGATEVCGAAVFWAANNRSISGGVLYGVFIAIIGGTTTVAGGWVKRLESHVGLPQGPQE
jgi:multidrug transporter EmrE-like cation transporter